MRPVLQPPPATGAAVGVVESGLVVAARFVAGSVDVAGVVVAGVVAARWGAGAAAGVVAARWVFADAVRCVAGAGAVFATGPVLAGALVPPVRSTCKTVFVVRPPPLTKE